VENIYYNLPRSIKTVWKCNETPGDGDGERERDGNIMATYCTAIFARYVFIKICHGRFP
jgi:hypothetical protein